MTDRISGGAFKQMVAFGAACIAQQKQTINDLNVFPVPDGDTGTNMCLTIQTAVNELRKNQPATVEEAAKIRHPACCGAPAATPASFCPCCSAA